MLCSFLAVYARIVVANSEGSTGEIMVDWKNIDDKRLVFLESLIRYADESGNDKPQFNKDAMLKRLGMCEHVFNKLQRQIGNKCCHMLDNFDQTNVYAINLNQCMGLHNRLVQESLVKIQREGIEKKVLATLIGTFFVVLVFVV
jgi:hypothetical protein